MGYLMTSLDPWRCCEAVRSAILAAAWLLVTILIAMMLQCHRLCESKFLFHWETLPSYKNIY